MSKLVSPNQLMMLNEKDNITSKEIELLQSIQLEQLISYLSSELISLPLDHIEEGINRSLQAIGEFLEIDRSYIFLFVDEQKTLLTNSHEWCAPGIDSQKDLLKNYKIENCSNWFIGKLSRLEVVNVSNVEEIGIEANVDKEFLQKYGIKSLLAVPIVENKTWMGFVGFDAVNQPKIWSKESIMLLQVFVQMLSNLWQRQKNETELRKSKHFLASLINSLPGIVFSGEIHSKKRIMNYLSAGCFDLTGYINDELTTDQGTTYHEIIHPEDLPQVIKELEKSLQNEQIYEIEYRIRTKSGEQKWILEKGQIIGNSVNELFGIEGFITDISKLKADEILITKQAEILEMIARGALLEDIFNKLIKTVEECSPGVLCSIMTLNSDETHLNCYLAPSLDPSYQKAAQGVPIAKNLVLCGEAAFSKERVIISDTFTHPNCSDYLELLKKHNLRAGWSTPILSSQEKLLGTFAMYSQQVKTPTAEELQLTETISNLAAIALEGNQAQEYLKQAEAKYRSIFENVTHGIFQSTVEGRYLSANPALARIYNYQSPEELIQKITNIGEQLYVCPLRGADLAQILDREGYVHNFESQVYQSDGSIIWISESTRAVYSTEGKLLCYEGTVEDITKRHRAEEQLIHQAFHDSLTGLPNRTWLIEKLKKAIELAKKQPDYQYAVLFIDLDGFKIVNDSLGHTMGDKLLQQVAQRLQTSMDSHQSLARLGGDEFVILVEKFQKVDQVLEIVHNLQKQLQVPFELQQEKIFTNGSIGITLSEIGYETSEDVLRDADIAMYQAKAKGKATYTFFSPKIQNTALNRLQLENDLRAALEREEFSVHYQPIILLTTGRLMGFEALIRWYHPTNGLVSPGRFIPIAEEMGLIQPIGLWVLRQACLQMQKWKTRFPNTHHLTISVNLSVHQFKQRDLLEQISLILRETGIQGYHLKLEITESAFVETAGSEITILQGLKDLGIRLCIDDFGTGYSSLSRLHELPVDTLKIDQAFVRRLETNSNEIIKTIITLAHILNMNVIAEGIETINQLAQLQGMNCEMGQGYLFSRPVDPKMAGQIVGINLGSEPIYKANDSIDNEDFFN